MLKIKKKNEPLPNDEAIKNLLIILARMHKVTPEAIESATGIATKTIRNKFPLNLIKGEKNE